MVGLTCGSWQGKPRLATGVGTSGKKSARPSPRASSPRSSEHSFTAVALQPSIDNQFYSLLRAAAVRRERITAPWEESKAVDAAVQEQEAQVEAARNAAAAKRLADVEDGVQSLLELTRGADGVMVDYDFDASDDDDASSDDDDAGASHSNASVRPNVWLCTCASGLNSPRHVVVPITCADGAPGVQSTQWQGPTQSPSVSHCH